MNSIDAAWYRNYLSCPDCGGVLTTEADSIACVDCAYRSELSNPIELTPAKPKELTVTFSRVIDPQPDAVLNDVDLSTPVVSYDGPSAIRDSSELVSEMNRFLGAKGKVLDLGCGPRDQAVPIEYLGYEYVGVDYSNTKADLLVDAHALPFADETFDCVLSYAVLEHLHNPFVAITEIQRILKPGSIYIGTVSQGEPFHDSYFHHTAWGLISLISSEPKFKVKRIWSSQDTLGSLAAMGRYPRVIKLMLAFVDKIHAKIPWLAPRKMKWSKLEKRLDKLHSAGSICFVVQKDQ